MIVMAKVYKDPLLLIIILERILLGPLLSSVNIVDDLIYFN